MFSMLNCRLINLNHNRTSRYIPCEVEPRQFSGYRIFRLDFDCYNSMRTKWSITEISRYLESSVAEPFDFGAAPDLALAPT